MKICRVEKKREVVDVNYEVCNKYCCDTMRNWLDISKYSNRRTMWYNTKTERFMLQVKTENYHSYGENELRVETDMIYCPFCGTRLQEPIIKKSKKKSWGRKNEML